MRRAFLPAVVAVVVVGFLFLAVFPTRTWLSQRQAIAAEQARLAVLTDQNRALAARVDELRTDAEVERLAREQYHLVRPGEEAYAILPTPGAPLPVPSDAVAVEPPTRSWWQRAWDAVRPD